MPQGSKLATVPAIREMIRGGGIINRAEGAGRTAPTGTYRFTVFALQDCKVSLLGKTSAFSAECVFQVTLVEQNVEAVVCDPPRSGLEKPVAEWLCRIAPPTIRYVACNPVTPARDAAVLCHVGYHLASVQLFDFYPQTRHTDSLAVFDRT